MANTGKIIKSAYSKGFTVMPNDIAQSRELLLEEKGLLLFLNSLPETFVVYKSNLHFLLNETEGKVDRVFKSLRDSGYIVSTKVKDELGAFVGWEHTFSLEPQAIDPTRTLADVGQTSPIYKKQDNTLIKETYTDLLTFFNKEFNSQCRGDVKSKKQFQARLKEGWKLEDMKEALLNAKADSYHKSTEYKYISLEFITRADKLDIFKNVKKSNPQTTSKADANEQRYWSLIELGQSKPMDNNRFTYEERLFIIACQKSFDQSPPPERKLPSDQSSLFRTEIDKINEQYLQNG